MFDLTGQVAIVTGGNGGIGLGMTQGLASAGARVVVAARSEQKSADAVRSLRELGSDALAIRTDVTEDHPHRLPPVGLWRSLCSGIRREQGRAGAADKIVSRGMGH